MFIDRGMNIVGLLSGLFFRSPKVSRKPKKTSHGAETTQEAAARALQEIFHRNTKR